MNIEILKGKKRTIRQEQFSEFLRFIDKANNAYYAEKGKLLFDDVDRKFICDFYERTLEA